MSFSAEHFGVAASNVDGGTPDDGSANVGPPPRWAAYMNDDTQGVIKDRIFLSFHSNGGGGSARGSTSLINTGNPTPNPSPETSSGSTTCLWRGATPVQENSLLDVGREVFLYLQSTSGQVATCPYRTRIREKTPRLGVGALFKGLVRTRVGN